MRGGEFLIQILCIPGKAPVQLDVHLARFKIHDVIAVPDPAIFLDFLIADGHDVPISVLLDLQTVLVIPIADIHLPVPCQAWNNVFLVLALLIPLNHQLDKLLLGQRFFNIKHGRIQQYFYLPLKQSERLHFDYSLSN